MAIPYYLLGIIYLAGLVCALAFFAFNLYHLRRFGFFDFTAFVITILTSAVITLVVTFSIIFLVPIDWSGSGELFDSSVIDSINL